MYEFYGNISENETFEKRRLIKSVNIGSTTSNTIGAITRKIGGQYSFIKASRRSAANRNVLITQCILRKANQNKIII